MLFKATKNQLRLIALNAVNASVPVGLGVFHFQAKNYGLGDLPEMLRDDGSVNLDYVNGRMVKLYIKAKGEDTYEIRDTATSDYQSWVSKYKTPRELVLSVPGVEVK
jgi:hypothetical protein